MVELIPLTQRPWLSPEEAAALVGLDVRTIERAMDRADDYQLPAHRFPDGRTIRIFRPDLDAWMQRWPARTVKRAEPRPAFMPPKRAA